MVKKAVFVTTLLLALIAAPALVRAEDLESAGDGDGGASDQCATDLLNCYEAAAKIDNFWYRWAAGLDCELNFTSCVRIKIIGR